MMMTETHKLSEGRSYTLVRTEKFKTEFFSVSSAFPISKDEAPLTSLLLSVLRRGTEKYPTLQALNKRLDSLYGTELSIRNFYRGDYQVIGFSLDLLGKEYIPDRKVPLTEALEVVLQILCHPLLDENGLLLALYVEDEKRYQKDLIRSIKNNPAGYALDRAQVLFYEGRPCACPIYGTLEEVDRITPARLTAHWKKILAAFRPECFFVGSLEKGRLEEALYATLWKELATQREPIVPCRFFATVGNLEKKIVTEEFPSGQSHLIVGLRTNTILGDRDFYAMKVYNELLLGASPISKLFLELREKQSLCYSCMSSYQSYTGAIFIRCGLSKDCRDQATEEIDRQLRALAKGRFSKFELEATKSSFLTAFQSIEDSPEALEAYFFGRAIMGLEIPLEESRRAIAALTKEDILRAANKVACDTEFFLCGIGEEKVENHENDEN